MPEGRRSLASPAYLWSYARRRWFYILVVSGLLIVILVLLRVASPLPDYGQNLSLNVGADLIGTVVVLFLVAPFLARGELHRESVLERFDHGGFIKRTADARQCVMILELWTDLLQDKFTRPFLNSLSEATKHGVKVRILLLDPDARAAEQRADDLRNRTAVVDNIMDNLKVLHDFVEALPEGQRPNIEVRVYSALPPVQMYRVDDSAMISFFPVDTTSWNAAQYQTSPRTQLGSFVGSKFEELWEAQATRTLAQFRTIEIVVSSEGDERDYRVDFVEHHDVIYVSGHQIVNNHANSGVAGLTARVGRHEARDEPEPNRTYELFAVDTDSEEGELAHRLFSRKYGDERLAVVLKLAEPLPGA